MLPTDFEYVGHEDFNNRSCYVVQSRVGGYRLDIGVADGRLYRQTWLLPNYKNPKFNEQVIFQKIARENVKNYKDWERWNKTLSPAESLQAWRDLKTAEFEFTRPVDHHVFDDYRKVAHGCWLPFRQTLYRYDSQSAEITLQSRSEQLVTDVQVNKSLPDDLFHIDLHDGVPVTTDRRDDPIIRYKYNKNQTEDDRIELWKAAKKARDAAKQNGGQ